MKFSRRYAKINILDASRRVKLNNMFINGKSNTTYDIILHFLSEKLNVKFHKLFREQQPLMGKSEEG